MLKRLSVPVASAFSKHRKAAVGLVTLGIFAAPSLAQTTPTMPEVDFPLDIASIVTAIGAAGATMLAAWAGLWVAFRLIRKLISRVGSAV